MSDIQKLVAVTALTSTVMFIDDLEQGSGQHKKDAGNTRRMALHRVLTREHKREMRAAKNGAPFGTECDDCGRVTCLCASSDRDCRIDSAPTIHAGRSVFTLPGKPFNDDADVSDFLACCGDAFLDDIVVDLNRLYTDQAGIDIEELKLHDHFWADQESTNEEPSMNFHNQDFDMTIVSSADDDFATAFFAIHDGAYLPVLEVPSLRRKFIDLPGGRTKRAKNRFGNCYYSNSEYHRPTRRQKGFADADVIDFLEEAAHLSSEKRKAERRREIMEASLESQNANSRNRNHGASKRNRRGKGLQVPTVEVVVKGRFDWARRLPPGYVMKTETGKLVWVAYEQALAA